MIRKSNRGRLIGWAAIAGLAIAGIVAACTPGTSPSPSVTLPTLAPASPSESVEATESAEPMETPSPSAS
ncbi:MAG TPA: hypothetical protein VGQ58_04285 [Candidatus Limnocylindrales bacterium]|jgi:hypothetical protein|nr:hypothetical protein [Candidatus Limnocylindrales bacterium]